MTGCWPPVAGVKTFRNRQFSDVLAWPKGEAACGQCGANAVAARTPGQLAAGCGGCQRSAPTGGAAYGMPRNSSTPPLAIPPTSPLAVLATGPPAAAPPATAPALTAGAVATRLPRVRPATASRAPIHAIDIRRLPSQLTLVAGTGPARGARGASHPGRR